MFCAKLIKKQQGAFFQLISDHVYYILVFHTDSIFFVDLKGIRRLMLYQGKLEKKKNLDIKSILCILNCSEQIIRKARIQTLIRTVNKYIMP